VLERSAMTVGESLTARRADKQLLIETSTDWLVTDGARHWVLRHVPQSVTAYRRIGNAGGGGPFFVPVHLDVTDFGQATTALDQGRLPSADWIMPPGVSALDKNFPLKGAPVVTQLEAGRRWKVDYTRAVRVEIVRQRPGEALILRTVDGTRLYASKTFSSGAFDGLRNALNGQRLAEPLISLLPSGLDYQVAPVGHDWEISTTGEIRLAYAPGRPE